MLAATGLALASPLVGPAHLGDRPAPAPVKVRYRGHDALPPRITGTTSRPALARTGADLDMTLAAGLALVATGGVIVGAAQLMRRWEEAP